MPELKLAPTLADLQSYVVELELERGFSGQSPVEKCLLLGEEVGELFKAVRKVEGLSIDQASRVGHLAEEMADILIMLCAIANRYGVDLEQAFRDKEEVNKNRRWT
jgi:NTP pyrophosphatase (non-canonical NTP hydrolase)